MSVAKLARMATVKAGLRRQAKELRTLPRHHAKRRALAQDIRDTRAKYEKLRESVTGHTREYWAKGAT